MVDGGPEPGGAERAFWSWLGFWLQFLVLAACVVLGAFAASYAEQPGDYAAGILLILAALALIFLRLKESFDEPGRGPGDFLLVDRMGSLVVVIPLFVIIGLGGLFVAKAWFYGSLHAGGIALFVVSGIIIFLDLKRVFDRLN